MLTKEQCKQLNKNFSSTVESGKIEIHSKALGKDFDPSQFKDLGLDDTEEEQARRYNNFSDFSPEERLMMDNRRYAPEKKDNS
jgi:hypothetical protein